tara:strand:+ start:357 stop:659 length:303 start_codon:yes stop_codon:yes gene_type:complete
MVFYKGTQYYFNLGVEIGQIGVLIIVFPLLSLIKGKSFDSISKVTNWILVVAGIGLLAFQLNGYFSDDGHHQHDLELKKEQQLGTETHEHTHEDGHSHSH